VKLPYDPADGIKFWEDIQKIQGYPKNEFMPIKQMIFESGAVYKIPEMLIAVGADPSRRVILVIDWTPMRRGREDLKQLVSTLLQKVGWQLTTAIMDPDETGQVHTDMSRIEEVRSYLQPGCAMLSVGSGVVTDIAKHACYLFEQETGQRPPYVVFQTANSVSAFTSNMAPTFVDGVKRTLASRYPDALICDLETLRDAPREMTVAGVGDMLAAFVSLPDWYLANTLGMDPSYTELPKHLIGPLDEIFLSEAENIRRGSLEGHAILAKVIALGGLTMSLSHATAPMSGFEHVISHVLDLQAETANLPMAPHGTQVALATLLCSEVYRHFLEEFDPAELNTENCYPEMDVMEKMIKHNFGALDPSGKAGAECWSDYRIKLHAWNAHRSDFQAVLKGWPRIAAHLKENTSSLETLVKILDGVDAPLNWSELIPPMDEKRVKFAFFNAPSMRRRLTVGDLLVFTRWDREQLWQQVWKRCRKIQP
jgi:glycerol-1-phosphate dehydrogenase [NAD(P)+]